MAITAERRTKRATKKQNADAVEAKGEGKKRHRRSPEEMIKDLELEIAQVKARAAARQAKQSDEGKAFMLAVKAVDRALAVAQEAGDSGMVKTLEAARAPLSERLVAMGLRLPAKRGRRGQG
ncbi:MAG TPA: hypothetical protein VJP77_04270 [Planctomycetota bacterium]|nr:hypothetical protein [Planctomycetota bacterium]